MTNQAQTMLTIALTFAVALLLVDRMIEPAQAHDQNCASPLNIDTAVHQLKSEMNIIGADIQRDIGNFSSYLNLDCATTTAVDYAHMRTKKALTAQIEQSCR